MKERIRYALSRSAGLVRETNLQELANHRAKHCVGFLLAKFSWEMGRECQGARIAIATSLN